MPDSHSSHYSLRPIEKGDLAVVAAWFQDVEDLAAFDRTGRVPLSLAATEKEWEAAVGPMTENGSCWFAVETEDADVVGIVGLEGVSSVNRDAVIALFIDKSVRRNGVGLRSVALVLDLAFRQLGLNRITSYYRDDNERSQALVTRVGFQTEGKMRQAWYNDGQFLDMVVVGLLKSDWDFHRKDLAREIDPATTVSFGKSVSSSWRWPPNHNEVR